MSKTPSNNGQKTSRGQFQPGNPGGPGRPEGSRNKVTVALDKIAGDAGEAILKKMVEAAAGGDMRAAELVLARLWPVRRGRPVSLPLPKIESAADITRALSAVVDAVGAGDITPDEGAQVSAILETRRKAIETVELEARIVALEKAKP